MRKSPTQKEITDALKCGHPNTSIAYGNRCEDCWAILQNRYHGNTQRVRFEATPRVDESDSLVDLFAKKR